MNSEILDKIMHSYMWAWKLKQENDPKYSKLNFEFIAKTQEPLIEDWHLEFLKNQLINDGFIISTNGKGEPYELSPLGIKASQNGGYKSFDAEKQTDKDIKSKTLKNLDRSKYSLIISILAFIIPLIISLYTLTKNQLQPLELKELQERIQKIEAEENLKKDTSFSSEKAIVDTLKKSSNKK